MTTLRDIGVLSCKQIGRVVPALCEYHWVNFPEGKPSRVGVYFRWCAVFVSEPVD